jgi:hypothetical protein
MWNRAVSAGEGLCSGKFPFDVEAIFAVGVGLHLIRGLQAYPLALIRGQNCT